MLCLFWRLAESTKLEGSFTQGDFYYSLCSEEPGETDTQLKQLCEFSLLLQEHLWWSSSSPRRSAEVNASSITGSLHNLPLSSSPPRAQTLVNLLHVTFLLLPCHLATKVKDIQCFILPTTLTGIALSNLWSASVGIILWMNKRWPAGTSQVIQ